MKKTYIVAFIALYCFNTSLAQKPSKEIPNYILSENSNFVVYIMTPMHFGVKTTSRGFTFGSQMTTGERKKISPADYPSLDEGLFNAMADMYKAEFEKLNMHPAAFFNFGFKDMQDPEIMKNMLEQQMAVKPGFVFTITCSDWEKEKKAFEKNQLELKNVKPVSALIAEVGERDVSKMFLLAKMNMSADELFEELKKKIDEKGSAYFVKEMEINEEAFSNTELNAEFYDKLLKENASIEKYPDSSELKNSEILVVMPTKKDDMYYRHGLKMLEKFYPYKYKLIASSEYAEHLNKDYKYLLFGKYDLAEKTKTKVDGNKTKSTSQNVYLFYYVLKDLKTLDVYYGPDKSKLIKKASESPSWALKLTLKTMQDYFGWREK